MRVNTTGLVAAGHSELEQVAVYLAYLKSYNHMGSAFVRWAYPSTAPPAPGLAPGYSQYAVQIIGMINGWQH